MNTRFRQTGTFLLVAIIFLMVVGSLFASMIVGLFSTSSLGQVVMHNGNTALAAARSGLQYAIYQREQQTGACTTPLSLTSLQYPTSTNLSPTPCLISTFESTPVLASSCVYTISSLATCDGGGVVPATRRMAIRVRGVDGPSTWDSYQLVPGSLADVTFSPGYGTVAGGTAVTIRGVGFTGATTVSFGGTAVTGLTIISDSKITVTTPAHASGLVDIIITTPEVTITLPQAFTYQ